MSTNHTSNYNLCQWEPSDQVLRTDFNADNAKIDAALAGQQSMIHQLKSVTDIAYTQTSKPMVTGFYMGSNVKEKHITLGFRPSALMVFSLTHIQCASDTGYARVWSAFAIPNTCTGDQFEDSPAVKLTSDGFTVFNTKVGMIDYLLNDYDHKYIYFAFR